MWIKKYKERKQDSVQSKYYNKTQIEKFKEKYPTKG